MCPFSGMTPAKWSQHAVLAIAVLGTSAVKTAQFFGKGRSAPSVAGGDMCSMRDNPQISIGDGVIHLAGVRQRGDGVAVAGNDEDGAGDGGKIMQAVRVFAAGGVQGVADAGNDLFPRIRTALRAVQF